MRSVLQLVSWNPSFSFRLASVSISQLSGTEDGMASYPGKNGVAKDGEKQKKKIGEGTTKYISIFQKYTYRYILPIHAKISA